MMWRDSVKAGAATVGFVKGLAEMTETGVADFHRGLRDVELARFQKFGRAFDAKLAEILGDGDAHLFGKSAAQIKMAAADLFSELLEGGRIAQIGPQQRDHLFAAFAGESFLAVAE